MTVLAVLPSRYNAARFPGKPLALIANRPMIQWVWEAASKAKGIDEVIVATDDDRIASVVTSFGGKVVFTDPSLPSGTDRVAAAVKSISGKFDVIVNIQGDEPAMHHETISAVVKLMLNNYKIDIGTAACSFTHAEDLFDHNVVKLVTNDANEALYFSRSPIPYIKSDKLMFQLNNCSLVQPNQLAYFKRHLGIYAYRPESLAKFTNLPVHPLEQFEKLEQLRALAAGMTIGVANTLHLSVGVDVPSDIQHVETLLIRRQS